MPQEIGMRLFVTRIATLAALVGLYALNPLVGVAGLVCGFAYLVWRRRVLYSRSPNVTSV